MQQHVQGGEQSQSDVDWQLTVALNDMCDTAYQRLQTMSQQLAEMEHIRAMRAAEWGRMTREAILAARQTFDENLIPDSPLLNAREVHWLNAVAHFARLHIQHQVEADEGRRQIFNLLYRDDDPLRIHAVAPEGYGFPQYTFQGGQFIRVGNTASDPGEVRGPFYDVNVEEGYLLVGDHERCTMIYLYEPGSFHRTTDIHVVKA